MNRGSGWLLLPVLALIAIIGCGDTGGPSVQYVEGVVTLDGKPIEGVTVTFSPVKAGEGTPAVGTTDASGVFKLTATQGGKPGGGAGVGEYQVAFSKVKVAGGADSAVTKSTDPGYGKPSSREPTKVEHEVPEKYENPATSGFKVTVKSGTNRGDAFKFDLKKE
jgi:hypothetical protein